MSGRRATGLTPGRFRSVPLPRPPRAPVLIVLLAPACLGGGPPPAFSLELGLNASDFLDAPQALDQLPRRPRLNLTHEAGFSLSEHAYVLFPGDIDAAWRDDLERAPLRSEHIETLIDVVPSLSPAGLTLEPSVALDADSAYVLAVAGWAKSHRGTPLSPDRVARTFALRTAAGADAGARVKATWPLDGASAVSPTLTEAVFAFDGTVQGANEGAWLEGPDGLAIDTSLESGPCAQLAPEQPGVFCVRLQPRARLAPATLHRLVVGEGALDAHGAPVGPLQTEFRTSSEDDRQAPRLRAPACAVDEQALEIGCALLDESSLELRVISDEPALALLRVEGREVGIATPAGEFALHVTGLEADAALRGSLAVRDVAGNQVEHALAFHTAPFLATVAITEVLADPLGPEPAQEWIELFNYGALPVELQGFGLSDRRDAVGQLFSVRSRLSPGERALCVADTYDPEQGRDPAPAQGVTLLRIGKSLTGSGLSNAGEALYLRDAAGRRISAAPATPRPRAGQCSVRVADDMRDGSSDAFAIAEVCTPGR